MRSLGVGGRKDGSGCRASGTRAGGAACGVRNERSTRKPLLSWRPELFSVCLGQLVFLMERRYGRGLFPLSAATQKIQMSGGVGGRSSKNITPEALARARTPTHAGAFEGSGHG